MTKQLIETLLTLSNLGKQEVETLKQELKDSLENGELQALKLYVGLKVFEDLDLGETIKPFALNEMQGYDSKETVTIGCAILKKSLHTVYDYSQDVIWQRLKAKETDLSTLRKNREKVMKSVPKPDVIKGVEAMKEIDTETGELIRILPPNTKQQDIITVKIS